MAEEKIEQEINEEKASDNKGLKKKEKEKYLEEIEKLKADVNHWKNEYYMAYADTKNLRNSLEKEHHDAIKYRAEGFIDSLLPILDSFHLALEQEVTDPNLKNYLTGFKFIYRNFVSALEQEGVSEFAPNIGDKFDPKNMDAVDTIIDEEKEINTVTKIFGKGYKLHDRLVRPAMVQVVVNKETKEKNTEENEEKADA